MKEGFESLRAYELAYQGAMSIYDLSKSFPPEEKYSLTDQVRRASRSVCANTAEAYRKRRYPRHYVMKLSDADGEASETLVWLNFAKDCGYLNVESFVQLTSQYHEVGKLLGFMMDNPEKFGCLVAD